MDNTQKLLSDIDRLKKQYRAEHNNAYDGEAVCKKINNLFANNNRFLGDIAALFTDYWFNTYIATSPDIKNEPTAENLDRLAAMQSLLEGETEGTDCLTDSDWHEMCELVNEDAAELPLDALNNMMAIFVDKQSL